MWDQDMNYFLAYEAAVGCYAHLYMCAFTLCSWKLEFLLLLAQYVCILELLQIFPAPGGSFVVNINNNKHACQIFLWSLAASWSGLCRTSFVPVTNFLCSREAFTTHSTSRAAARRIHLLCMFTGQTALRSLGTSWTSPQEWTNEIAWPFQCKV